MIKGIYHDQDRWSLKKKHILETDGIARPENRISLIHWLWMATMFLSIIFTKRSATSNQPKKKNSISSQLKPIHQILTGALRIVRVGHRLTVGCESQQRSSRSNNTWTSDEHKKRIYRRSRREDNFLYYHFLLSLVDHLFLNLFIFSSLLYLCYFCVSLKLCHASIWTSLYPKSVCYVPYSKCWCDTFFCFKWEC